MEIQCLEFTNLKFSDGHALQGAIEHFCEMLKANRIPRKFGEVVLTDFEIGYYSDILKGLVTIREHGKIIVSEKIDTIVKN